MQFNSQNPLAKHFRQPKIYLTLPSGGNWYDGGLNMTETGELPVFSMTARDELRYKTPDALLNGHATVEVIESCIPNITNAWAIPNIDLDAILVAIRIATYGEKLELTTTIPVVNEERTYIADLRVMLDSLLSQKFENIVEFEDFKAEIRPLNYKYSNEISMKTFEEQRIFYLLNKQQMDDADKLTQIQNSFDTLTNMTIELVKRSIVAIKYKDDDPVTNPEFINEFIDNAEKGFYYNIVKHIESQREKFSIKPMVAPVSPDDIEAGAPETVTIPILFDQSSFFANGS